MSNSHLWDTSNPVGEYAQDHPAHGPRVVRDATWPYGMTILMLFKWATKAGSTSLNQFQIITVNISIALKKTSLEITGNMLFFNPTIYLSHKKQHKHQGPRLCQARYLFKTSDEKPPNPTGPTQTGGALSLALLLQALISPRRKFQSTLLVAGQRAKSMAIPSNSGGLRDARGELVTFILQVGWWEWGTFEWETTTQMGVVLAILKQDSKWTMLRQHQSRCSTLVVFRVWKSAMLRKHT